MKYTTQGVDPKVPVQAITTLVVALLAYFGVNLDPVVSGALAVVIGGIAGIFAPAPKTQLTKKKPGRSSWGGEKGQYDPLYLLVVVLIVILILWAIFHFQ